MSRTNYDKLEDRIENLEAIVAELHRYIKFHKLEKIPLKYTKAFPSEDENPFFRHTPFKPTNPKCMPLAFGNNLSDIEIPKDPKIFTQSKERMAHYFENSKKIPLYYEIYNQRTDEIVGETTDYKEANKCVEEGPKYTSQLNGIEDVKINELNIRTLYRIVTPKNAVVSSASISEQVPFPPSQPEPSQ